jgi:GNAT superfamily N-acetyltransferase
VVVELAPGADPELPGLLAFRGYRIRQFQQVWLRELEGDLPEPLAQVRPIAPEEADLASRVVQAGFLDSDDVEARKSGPALAMTRAEGSTVFLAFVDGVPAGAGIVGIHAEVATLSGTSVLPRFRGRGLQRAMIHARLNHAREHGCVQACSATLPGTASQASLERAGFRVAYPKLELAKEKK